MDETRFYSVQFLPICGQQKNKCLYTLLYFFYIPSKNKRKFAKIYKNVNNGKKVSLMKYYAIYSFNWILSITNVILVFHQKIKKCKYTGIKDLNCLYCLVWHCIHFCYFLIKICHWNNFKHFPSSLVTQKSYVI